MPISEKSSSVEFVFVIKCSRILTNSFREKEQACYYLQSTNICLFCRAVHFNTQKHTHKTEQKQ